MSGSLGRLASKGRSNKGSLPSKASIDSGSPSLSDTPPASPPTRLVRGNETASSAIRVEFPRGGSFSRGGTSFFGITPTTATTATTSQVTGGPPTVESNSSMDSGSTGGGTGFSQSPSSTPPKKTWERNYKSFLKKSVGKYHHHPIPDPSVLPPQRRPASSLDHHGKQHRRASITSDDKSATAELESKSEESAVEGIVDFGSLGLADAFANHMDDGDDNGGISSSSASSSPLRPGGGGATSSQNKEHSTRGGAFFRRLRSKTKSEDSLDSTMRRGVDRRSPSASPASSPTNANASRRVCTIQDGLEKAALLSETLGSPVLSHDFHSSIPLLPQTAAVTTITTQPLKEPNNNNNNNNRKQITLPSTMSSTRVSSLVHNIHNTANDNLDRAMHHGHTASVSNGGKSKVMTAMYPASLSRVNSMGTNLTIKEGEPRVTSSEEEALMREKRKAFTDFHSKGVDSTSAFLGDESSLHKNSAFLSSMAYPANSSAPPGRLKMGGTSGAQSYDKKTTISSSTSENAIQSNRRPSTELEDATDITPERALKPVKGPESWKKGERHSIIPAILCMCPFQVLNKVMSDDGGAKPPRRPSTSGQSMLSSSLSGYGIGSMMTEDDHMDSSQNGWFFADHHQQPQPIHQRRNITTGVLPSAFGKIILGKATVAALGVRSFFNEVYGWSSGIFVLRQNYLFEYRESDNLNGLPWGYAHLQLAEAYPHKHFTNALHVDFFEKPCVKSGKRSLLMRVEDKGERDRWVSLLQAAARTTIHDLYDVDVNGGPEFGRGRYAVVRPARRRQTRRISSSHDGLRLVSSGENLSGSNKDLVANSSTEYDCALKIINKKEFWSRVKRGAERADTLVREAAVQTTLAVQGADTPGFLTLRSIFETGDELVLELELLKGTDLFQHVSSRGTLDEVEAAHIMTDLLQCLDVMDQIGIAHRDIKPANLLMCDENCVTGCKIKMADFGMASFVGVDNLVRGRCGTPGFVAPEILRTAVTSGYENKVDMFSAGVTLYVMLAGYEPFYGESDAELISANTEAKVDFPQADWHKISVEGRDLVEKMLTADPTARISPAGALRHPWITRRASNAVPLS